MFQVVGFDVDETNIQFGQPYLMIECTVYFEPYYHVLKALQSMNERNFPMKQYIVDVQNNIVPPGYVNGNTVIHVDGRNVALLLHEYWPRAESLNLDDTQLAAFHAALTQQFAIVQGPPGTGKTYVGLKIARTLIKNKDGLGITTPILVVCFTNHALDQFLEGLIGTTKDIVRVGGQSKNKQLEEFNLRNKRSRFTRRNALASSTYALRDDLRCILLRIKCYNNELEEIAAYKSIINFRKFAMIADDRISDEFCQSWFAKANTREILEWLFGGRTPNARADEEMRIRLNEVSFCQNILIKIK